jgi:hypothetical protein
MAKLLQSRATQTYARIDTETALLFAQDAASSIPEKHVHHAVIMVSLARIHELAQTSEFGSICEMVLDGVHWTPPWEDKAVGIHLKRLNDPPGDPTIRMTAAAQLMSISEQRVQYSRGVKIGLQVLDILYKTNTRSLSRDDQQRITAGFSDIAIEICALSIKRGSGAADALGLLELGGGLILGLLIENQSDLSAIAPSYPEQATRFKELLNSISLSAHK